MPTPPFSLDLTAGYQTYFQGEVAADSYRDGVYRRLVEWDGLPRLLSVRATGAVDAPQLEVTVSGQALTSADQAKAHATLSHVLDADLDLRPFYQSVAGDPVLAGLVAPLYGLHSPRMPSVFEGLVFAISGQQIAASVARHIRTLLVQRFGGSLPVDGRVHYAFPTPGRLLEAGMTGLREVKLSARKAEYILDIAARAQAGELELETLAALSSQALVEQLCALRGVGLWTAEWLLLRTLGRKDIFPAGDLALRRVVSALYFESRQVSEAEARAFAERWGAFKTLATVYLFGAARLGLVGRKAPVRAESV